MTGQRRLVHSILLVRIGRRKFECSLLWLVFAATWREAVRLNTREAL